eukprot:TRINITY_DN18343_c0_g1_i1.p1 TRINITY_DN18343_c0_g1~~TRINITY_DN18343_c0_g1_i1.p1  ORF type:complete len:268 (-),score=53.10 TRINITY_DN18343_c0_g1_i1:143-946(-)
MAVSMGHPPAQHHWEHPSMPPWMQQHGSLNVLDLAPPPPWAPPVQPVQWYPQGMPGPLVPPPAAPPLLGHLSGQLVLATTPSSTFDDQGSGAPPGLESSSADTGTRTSQAWKELVGLHVGSAPAPAELPQPQMSCLHGTAPPSRGGGGAAASPYWGDSPGDFAERLGQQRGAVLLARLKGYPDERSPGQEAGAKLLNMIKGGNAMATQEGREAGRQLLADLKANAADMRRQQWRTGQRSQANSYEQVEKVRRSRNSYQHRGEQWWWL